jgi:hypothetical protein
MKEYKLFVFNMAITVIYISYFAVFYGIISLDKTYIRNFSTLIQLGVCMFLIYRFFPYKTTVVSLTPLDVSIIFYCASFLLLNVVATEVYVAFFQGTVVDKYINTAAAVFLPIV